MLYSLLFERSSDSFGTKLVIFLTFTFAVIFALTIHEFAHGLMAYKLGDDTPKKLGRLTLNPMAHFDTLGLVSFLFLGFGWAKPVPVNPFNFKKIKRDMFFVSIAGILVNFICAFIFYPFALLCATHLTGGTDFITILFYLFLYLYQINLIFMVFNLLPIYPLDGFNAIASHLKYTNPFVQFMLRYGMFILIFVIVIFHYTNIFEWLVTYIGYPINRFWNLIILGA